ncbi:MAG TPA: hypothetical protein VGR62_07585, partial [Candidatus Binatia bacterium]|nr:hypothetical protein [Candidatus Binatia bacterium]
SAAPGATRLSYSSDGRGGHVHYQSHDASFTLYYEFGGGDCVASIDLPSPTAWRRHTGLPLERRDEVVRWIGQRVVHDQTTGGTGRFEIEGNWLNIYA